MLHPFHAILLGLVEGLTEFLPVSSTGHLILASHLLGLHGAAVNTFDVVIQAGALVAVLGLYRTQTASMWRGFLGRDAAGQRLAANLLISALPALVLGLAWHHAIKTRLFGVWPVALALALGGLFMIAIDGWLRALQPKRTRRTLGAITPWEALLVGLAQCLALWPGTSRAMVTLVAGLLLGWPARLAAEYSFLLALPTLGAVTLFDAVKDGGTLTGVVSLFSMVCGFASAAVVAALAMRGFVIYLRRRGLAPFGWYRVGLAALVWLLLWR